MTSSARSTAAIYFAILTCLVAKRRSMYSTTLAGDTRQGQLVNIPQFEQVLYLLLLLLCLLLHMLVLLAQLSNLQVMGDLIGRSYP